LYISEDNWLYKDIDFKRQEVKKLGIFEFVDDDHIIGYKGIGSDRYSNYNFQYQYLKGETYESHCDHTNDENSFGFSIRTKEKAIEWCDELLVKVKVNINDIGRVFPVEGRIRCSKMTILD
jgi:hypothetical protein